MDTVRMTTVIYLYRPLDVGIGQEIDQCNKNKIVVGTL